MTFALRAQFMSVAALLLAGVGTSSASDLCPKYGECVPADQFTCEEISRSSFITRLCYNEPGQYMVLRLNQTDYHYCGIPRDDVASFLSAPSMGQFYNANIKGGPFDCRINPVPSFQ